MYLAELQVIGIAEFTSKDLELRSVDKGITFSSSNQGNLCNMDTLNA
jgi:hypothetical protein